MSSLIEVREIDQVKGRGVFALCDLPEPNTCVFSVPVDIAVLYSAHVANHCAICFKAIQGIEGAGQCAKCRQFAMCPRCQTSKRGVELTQHHAQVCAWFMLLPQETREGDTDYLRFLLEYSARVQQGDTRVALAVSDCCTNADSQSAETKQFCESFSKLTATKFAPAGLVLDQDHLRDTLLRVKSNAVGFPFNEQATLGWAMQGEVCMLNHSCVPNCALRQTEDGEMDLRTLRPIAADEELTISYIFLPDFPRVAERTKQLLESYRFLCKCEVCVAQREGKGAPPVGVPPPQSIAKAPAASEAPADGGAPMKSVD